MKRVLTLAAVGVVCAACLACHPGTAGLSDQDKAAIRKVYDEAIKIDLSPKPDFDAYVKLYYTEDATVLMPNTPPVQGRAAITAVFASMPPMTDFKADIVDIDGRGDLAYVRGNYSMTMNPPGASPVTDKGKYVEVWKKQSDGSWKAAYDSWSSDLPVSGLLVPTGTMAANASAEVKKLADIVGRWQITGTGKLDPQAAAQPVALSLDCQWFASGLQVVCAYSGTSAGQPFQQADIFAYDAATKTYTIYSAVNPAGAMAGKLTIEGGKWTHVWNFAMGGKPAKVRLTVSNPTPEGGTWTNEMSMAGGPWVPLGEGKYVKAK